MYRGIHLQFFSSFFVLLLGICPSLGVCPELVMEVGRLEYTRSKIKRQGQMLVIEIVIHFYSLSKKRARKKIEK